jgi:hypothetical protein
MSGRDRRESAAVLALALFAMGAPAANFPPPLEGDLVLKDFYFQGRQTLPELRMHYLTLGQPERDRQGVVRNDLINPPELRVLEREIKRVKLGQAIVIPFSDQTVGHGSHTKAVLWKKDLARLLRRTEKK